MELLISFVKISGHVARDNGTFTHTKHACMPSHYCVKVHAQTSVKYIHIPLSDFGCRPQLSEPKTNVTTE